MSFGFPAFYKVTRPIIGSRWASRDAAVYAFENLGWDYTESSRGDYQVLIGSNGWSWGEVFSVSFQESGMLTIESKCVLVTQCIDWGKNKRNVKQFLAHYEGKEYRESRLHPKDPQYLDENERTPVERVIETVDS